MANELILLSPEKAIVSFRVAGLGSRVLAHLLDLTILGGAILILLFALMSLAAAQFLNPALALVLVYWCLAMGWFFYFTLFESFWNGQTLGKKAVGIAVRSVDGTPVTFLGALGRNALRPADFFPAMYFLGLLAMFTNPKSQRIGDLAAGTMVLHVRRPQPKFTPAPHAISLHPLESFVGELQGMTIEEYVALKRFCDRYPELAPHAQVRFMEEVWLPISLRRHVPKVPNVHPLYLAEAVVMKYGRTHGLL